MTVGTLPWDEIIQEVALATHHYFLCNHGMKKDFINIPYLVDWLMESPTPGLYPHITQRDWEVIEYRVTQGMRRMKWRKFARNIFVVPDAIPATAMEGAEA